MIQSSVMPVMVKLSRLRFQYKLQGLHLNQLYHVIGYDIKRLIITTQEGDRAFTVEWNDVELVRSEMTITQSRPNAALLSEMQLLRLEMKKLGSSMSSHRRGRKQTIPQKP